MRGRIERRVLLVTAAILVFLLVLWVVSLNMAEGTNSYSVSFMVSTESERLKRGVEQAAIDYNIDLHIISGYRSGEVAKQTDYLEREIRSQVDGIILQPEDPALLENFLRGNRITMPMLTLYSEIDDTLAGFVGIDNKKAGLLLAQAVLESGGTEPLTLVLHEESRSAVQERTDAFVEAMNEEKLDVEIVTVSDGDELSMCFLLRPDTRFVFPEEALLLEACHLAGENQRIFGCGFQPALRQPLETGVISALVVWSDYDIGYMALEQIASELRSESNLNGIIALHIARGENMYDPPLAQILFPIG